MSIPIFELTIWHRPERGNGYLVHIDTEFLGLNVYQQSPAIGRSPEFNPDTPYRTKAVSEQWLSILAEQFDRTVVSLAERRHTVMLGGSHYGLRLSRGFQTLTLAWAPRFEDQSEHVCRLWSLVNGVFDV